MNQHHVEFPSEEYAVLAIPARLVLRRLLGFLWYIPSGIGLYWIQESHQCNIQVTILGKDLAQVKALSKLVDSPYDLVGSGSPMAAALRNCTVNLVPEHLYPSWAVAQRAFLLTEDSEAAVRSVIAKYSAPESA